MLEGEQYLILCLVTSVITIDVILLIKSLMDNIW